MIKNNHITNEIISWSRLMLELDFDKPIYIINCKVYDCPINFTPIKILNNEIYLGTREILKESMLDHNFFTVEGRDSLDLSGPESTVDQELAKKPAINETILGIEQVNDFIVSADSIHRKTFDGYIIATNRQTIKIGISNDQDCCEDWGYLSSPDDIDDFIGAKLTNISLADEAGESTFLDLKNQSNLDGGDAMVVNIDTDQGLLQLAVYNSHNGYYSHTAVLISNELREERNV